MATTIDQATGKAVARRTALLDLGLLVLRVTVGVVFILHGWQKFNDQGVAAVTQMLTGFAIPYPEVAAYLLIALEMVGGLFLMIGLLVRVLGLLFLVDMAGAFWFVHYSKGFFAAGGGYELVLVLGAVALMLICTGGGRFGIDGAYAGRRRARVQDRVDAPELEPAY